MTDFNIQYGKSTEIFINGELNPNLLIEEGCWYLCTDTAELFLGTYDTDEKGQQFLTLKLINNKSGEFITESDLAAYGFLTEHQDISGKADKSELFSKDYNDLTNKPVIPSIEGLATEEFVEAAIAEAELAGKEIDLSTYATKTYVAEEIAKIEIPEPADLTDYAKKSDVPSISDFIEAIPVEYVTDTELASKGYLTQHQDISHLVSKSDLEVNLDNYYTKDETTAAIVKALADDTILEKVLFTDTKVVNNPIGQFEKNENIAGYTLAKLFAKLLGFYEEPDTPEEPGDNPGVLKTPEEILAYVTENNASIYTYDDTDTLVQAPFTEPVAWTTSEASVRMDGISTKYTIKDGDTVVEAGYQQATTYSGTYWLTVALPSEINNITVKLFDPDVPGWIEQNWHMVPADEQTIDGYTIWTVPEEFEIDAGATYRFVIIN